MRVRFRRIVVSMDCFYQDPPVLLEVTTKGELVLHNYDRDTEIAAEALGLDPSRCYEIENQWGAIVVYSIARRLYMKKTYASLLPKEVMRELLRVGPLIKEAAESAFRKTTYRKPSSRWIDRAGMSFSPEFFGPRAAVPPSVLTRSNKVWHSKYKKCRYPGIATRLDFSTTVPIYITLLNKIPEGVVYDPRQDVWCMAAGIVEVVNRDNVIVVAGKQGRGVAVDSRNALVQKGSDGSWVVKKWL
jgi:hypothetical protein